MLRESALISARRTFDVTGYGTGDNPNAVGKPCMLPNTNSKFLRHTWPSVLIFLARNPDKSQRFIETSA